VFAGEAFQELIGQKRDITDSFAQRGHVDRHDVEAEEQVLPEFLPLHAFLQPPVRGGNDPHIHLDRAVATHALEVAFLQYAEQFGLHGGGDLADFVQQDRAAVGKFEPAFTFAGRTGEGPFLVTKEFALNEVLRYGRAIDLDVRTVGVWTRKLSRQTECLSNSTSVPMKSPNFLSAARKSVQW
jgi:hypothetical protein